RIAALNQIPLELPLAYEGSQQLKLGLLNLLHIDAIEQTHQHVVVWDALRIGTQHHQILHPVTEGPLAAQRMVALKHNRSTAPSLLCISLSLKHYRPENFK
ncbi:MAG: hypothetical protein DRP87_20040, partial [Spirochaetes bacterium]